MKPRQSPVHFSKLFQLPEGKLPQLNGPMLGSLWANTDCQGIELSGIVSLDIPPVLGFEFSSKLHHCAHFTSPWIFLSLFSFLPSDSFFRLFSPLLYMLSTAISTPWHCHWSILESDGRMGIRQPQHWGSPSRLCPLQVTAPPYKQPIKITPISSPGQLKPQDTLANQIVCPWPWHYVLFPI